ncbi:MAG: murein biosynthesis integral membrane protein MurJ [Parcubacteria group bacterium]|jgi:putative peptidoglycan lipid II flippase
MIANFKKTIIKSSRESIAAAAAIVAFFGILSRLLGVVRDRVLAGQFGAGDTLDAYYAAFRLPDLTFELLVVGALAAAFIPIFSKLIAKEDGHDDACIYASGVLTVIVFSVAVLAVVGMVFAPFFIHIMAPGFPADKMADTVRLSRIMFISPIFLSASAVLGGVLVSFRRFLIYSMAPIFYNIGIIIGAVFFTKYIGLIGLAWGVIFGAILHFVIHIVAVRSVHFRFLFFREMPYRNSDVRKTIALMLPRMFSSASNQLSLLLVTFFASTLASGSVTIFTFANNVQSVVLGLIGVPFALAAFPVLSNKFAIGDTEAFTGVLSQTLRRILYYSVPLSMIFFVLREQIVRIVFGTGQFNLENTIFTYQVLGILCISLFAQSVTPLLARGFYAMQDTKTPFYIALASQILNACMIVVLIRDMKIYAIAIAFSITAVINAGLLFAYLHRSINDGEYRDTLRTFMQILIATFVTVVLTFFARNILGYYLPLRYVWGVLGQLVGAGSVGAISYLFVTAVFGVKEFETIRKKIIIRIFGRTQVASEEQNIAR